MLDGLDSIPWARLTCTYGTAQDVPGCLRILTSPSAKMRRAALWQLENALVHQSTVWTATVAAVPFFIELLRSPDVGSKDSILDLLSAFADGGYSGFDVVAQRESRDVAASPRNGVHEAPDEVDSSGSDGADDASQSQCASIRTGIPVYLALMDDPDPRVRVAAANLLVQCGSVTFDPLPALEAAYAHEAEIGVRVGLLLVRASTKRDLTEKITLLETAMRSAETSEERVAAAMMLAEVSRGLYHEGHPHDEGDETLDREIPKDALALLLGALTQPSRRVENAYALATRGRSLTASIGLALYDLPAKHLRLAAPQLMGSLTRIGRKRVGVAARLLLRALFTPTNGNILAPGALNAEQLMALDALFGAELFWRDRHMWLTRLGDYGLPESRPLLADYLGRLLPPQDELGAVVQPRPHRPEPFTLKAYEARISDIYGYLHIKRKKGYRFERRVDADFYSPDGFHLYYFARTTGAVLAMEREVALLGNLPRLPLMLWHPGDSSRDTRAIGRAFMGGLREAGSPLTRDALERLRDTKPYEQFASLLARFLRELHAVSLDTLRVSLPTLHARRTWEQFYADVQGRVFGAMSREQRQRIADRIEPFLVDDQNWAWTPTLVHGEFAPRNILYCSSVRGDAYLSAVVGFRNAGLGDPAYDLATLLGPEGYGEEYVRHFEGTYLRFDEELSRARFYVAALALRSALAAMEAGDQETFDRAIATTFE